MARQTALITALLMTAVSGLVFFGIKFGLRPLRDLEDAIIKRSHADLSPIARPVPDEAYGIVSRLNSLFARDTMYFLRPADIFAARVSEGSASVSWMKPTYPEMGSAFSLGEFMGVLVALGTDEERQVLSRRR